MATIIYEPSGKAREYSELAANFYTGCLHACKYCYCPSIMRKTLSDWSLNPHARTNIVKQFENDCKKATKEIKEKGFKKREIGRLLGKVEKCTA